MKKKILEIQNKVDKEVAKLLDELDYYVKSNSDKSVSEIYSELSSIKDKSHAQYLVWAYLKLHKKKLGLK